MSTSELKRVCGLPGCCLRRKRGRRGGLRQRIRRLKHKIPLPTVILGNVESLKNKIDELAALARYDAMYRNCCAMMLTETWLNPDVPDGCMSIDGFTLIRGDRIDDAGKDGGGGVCVYLNKRWCTNFIVKHTSCTRDAEILCVQCRPYYLPREFCCLYLIVIYIPPHANKESACETISLVVRDMERAKPDAAILVGGDFNRASLSDSLPTYKQYVNFVTYLDISALDLAYCNIKNAYKATKLPALGRSKHAMIALLPTYKRKLETQKPVVKTFRKWTAEAIEQLSGSFACTDWSIFEEDCRDLDTLVDTVSDYIDFCVECVVPVKSIRVYPNNRPWVTNEVISKIKNKRRVWASGNQAERRRVREELSNTIENCKRRYKERVEDCFKRNDSRSAWTGLSSITGYKKKDPLLSNPTDAREWAEELNAFYCRFEKDDEDPQFNAGAADATPPIDESDVRRVFLGLNANKAQGPDRISPRLLKGCAQELSPVFTKLFNRSLQERYVPKIWKTSTIVPVAKKPAAKEHNDFRPVALTSCVMKSMERLVLKRLLVQVKDRMDPLQFAYKEKRGVEDACSLLIHSVAQHLEKPKNYARILFVDFSSAFNTMRPSALLQKLGAMGVQTPLCQWILSYLRHRPQSVRVKDVTSSSRKTCIGCPKDVSCHPCYSLFTPMTIADKMTIV
jgi:hypothetical protein